MNITLITQYLTGITGLFLITFSIINKTENLFSSMIYKVIPFFLGFANLLVCLKMFGVL